MSATLRGGSNTVEESTTAGSPPESVDDLSVDDEPVRPTGFQQKPLRTFARLRPLHLPAERGLRSRPKGFCYEVISKDNNLAASVTPQHSGYRGVGAMLRMKCEDDTSPGRTSRELVGRDSYTFPFHRVLGTEVSQEEAFKEVALPVLESCMSGHNGCIFCYGQTGSGKTYTMSGGEGYAERGIIPRCIEELFAAVKRYHSSNPGAVTNISVSYLEVYNENAYDLLGESVNPRTPIENWPKVSILEDENGEVVLRNLSLLTTDSEDEALDMFMLGNVNRMVSSTAANMASSRSHTIFTLEVEQRAPGKETGTDLLRRWKLHLVDLAGSERVWKKNNLNSQVLQEAKYINRSLHFLEQVINSLQLKANGQRFHVPYRNSLLTSVLRDSLAGNCMTVMVANIAVNLEAFDESVATCRFAQRCSRLINSVRCTDRVDWETMCKRLTRANRALMERIALLEGEVAGHEEVKTSKSGEPSSVPMTTTVDRFVFAEPAPADVSGTWSVREVLQNTDANLAKHPKDRRKYLLSQLRAQGLDIRFSCAADLCAIIQVRLIIALDSCER
ncbi:hypothetical protein FOZ60_011695 [Perkinsus olseni]|uniref:Kinesin motor domain-containing protein n=1 Tax=Perkinsus olseni TaxID=32597 RepID=A0A7J6NDZ8_PEROL|nr:hypothetical protein FOZ60_011695 [Perkinsus olseni]